MPFANTGSTTATVAYTYDTLNRLLSASTTAASSTPYSQIFTYDLLGSLLSITSGGTSTVTAGVNGDKSDICSTVVA